MGYHVFIDKQQNGSFQATCPSMHKLEAYGKTRIEALSKIKKLMTNYIEYNTSIFYTDDLEYTPITPKPTDIHKI